MNTHSTRDRKSIPLGYSKPQHPGWERNTGKVIADTLVGTAMIGAGCVVVVVGIVMERIVPWWWFDRPLNLIPNELLRIAGKRPPERPKW